MRILVLMLSLLLSAGTFASGKVRIYKQWHLLANQKTSDIVASKKLNQYKNQHDIYTKIDRLVSSGKVKAVIGEGCGVEIDKNFKKDFNGWDYSKLKAKVKSKLYPDILTLIPLKLEVKYGKKLLTLCGDDDALIKKHQLAFSDLSGYLGFYLRLKQYKKTDKKKYQSYSKALLKGEKNQKQDAMLLAKKRAREALASVESYLHQRNKVFITKIKKNIHLNPAVVIGGLHLEDLVAQLKAQKLSYTVEKVKGFPEKDMKQLDEIKRLLK